jgi:hypothetical protein
MNGTYVYYWPRIFVEAANQNDGEPVQSAPSKENSAVKSSNLSKKSHAIVAALAEGHSCEQILAGDPALTYHDIFRAAAELPETQHHLRLSRATLEGWQNRTQSGRPPAKNGAMPKARD